MAADDDWRSIRAARWRAEQQSSSCSKPSAEAADTAAVPWTPLTASVKSNGSKNSTWRPRLRGSHAVWVGLLILLGLMIHAKQQQRRANACLNQSDTVPDARMRPAYAHRDYILGKAEQQRIDAATGLAAGLGPSSTV